MTQTSKVNQYKWEYEVIKRKNTLKHLCWAYLLISVMAITTLSAIIDPTASLLFSEPQPHGLQILLHGIRIVLILIGLCCLIRYFFCKTHLIRCKASGKLYVSDTIDVMRCCGTLNRVALNQAKLEKDLAKLEKDLAEKDISNLALVFFGVVLFSLLSTNLLIYLYTGGRFLLHTITAAINTMPVAVSMGLLTLLLIYMVTIQLRRHRRAKQFNVSARMIYADYTENMNSVVVSALAALSLVAKAVFFVALGLYAVVWHSLYSRYQAGLFFEYNQQAIIYEDMQFLSFSETVAYISFVIAFLLHCVVLYFVKPKDENQFVGIEKRLAGWPDWLFTSLWGIVLLVSAGFAVGYGLGSIAFYVACVIGLAATILLIRMVQGYLDFQRQSDLLPRKKSSTPSWRGSINTIEKCIDGENRKLVVAFKHSKSMWICFEIAESDEGGGLPTYSINTEKFYIASLGDETIVNTHCIVRIATTNDGSGGEGNDN